MPALRISLATAILVVSFAPCLSAQPPRPQEHELIVLLRAGADAPDPEEVVRAINDRRPAPGGLGEGNPYAARLLISERPRGRTLAWIRANPDAPLARLQRYVVLSYPDALPLDAGLEQALARNPNVLHVERNRVFELAVGASPPSDPLLGTALDPPEDAQWGLHLLGLPAAWGFAKGHASIGLIDTGLEVGHPDLRAFHREPDGTLVFDGGNFREHLARDFLFDTTCSVDELDPEDGVVRTRAGHGTHVSGIAAAATDNGQGVAGACWHCNLLMTKAAPQSDALFFFSDATRSLRYLIEAGAAIVSMSFGATGFGCEPGTDLDFFCTTLELAAKRDLVLFASSGNDKTAVEFPASDPRVVAVGGVEHAATASGFAPWDEADEPTGCPSSRDRRYVGNQECGSNLGPEQELVAPSRTVLSTVYTGFDNNTTLSCGDLALGGGADGFGFCTGTSMASPMVAGLAGLVRSINPLLAREQVRDVLTSTASHAGARSAALGFGVPKAEAAVRRALGSVGGRQVTNRLTPLFSLFSPEASTHVYTTSPAAGSAFVFDPTEPFDSVGPAVPGYGYFPDVRCLLSPCDFQPAGASVYVFTTDAPPFPGAPPLVPLHRLRYDPDLTLYCEQLPPQAHRSFVYTTTAEGVVHFKDEVVDVNGVGYEYEGIEGYVFAPCEPEPACIPAGAVRLYRLYHPGLDDYAIFPESELAAMQALGYVSQPGLQDWIGTVYPNVDRDGDSLIDGFETVLGTDPDRADSDCDGLNDGQEALGYAASDPDPTRHGYGDPLAGPCAPLFADGFETGNTGRWSATLGEP